MAESPNIRFTVAGDSVELITWGIRRAINERATAWAVVPSEYSVDFTMLMSLVDEEEDEPYRQIFNGHALSATFDELGCRIDTVSAIELTETALGAMNGSAVSTYERAYMVARIAGLDHDSIDIGPPPDVMAEEFLVQIAVDGVSVDQTIHLARVRLDPVSTTSPYPLDVVPILARLDPAEVTAVASVTVQSDMLVNAENAGVDLIVTALDGLLASNLYSLSKTPAGETLPFNRERFRARPRARQVVIVRGLSSKRAWVRNTLTRPIATKYEVGELVAHWPVLAEVPVPHEMRLAFASLRLAADESLDLVQRNQSLWDTAEFYSANVKQPKRFSREKKEWILTAAIESLPRDQFSDEDRGRVHEILNQNLNSRSLFSRLLHIADDDGAPLRDSEKELLKRLRNARNDAAHGRSGNAAPTTTDLAQATSLMARLLMFRWAAITMRDAGNGQMPH